MSSAIITLYDIPGTATADVAWSPNTWRTRFVQAKLVELMSSPLRTIRYVLHIKGLAYKTVWVEYPDVEPAMKKLGAQPTGIWSVPRDGEPLYTLPVIHDSATDAIVADSLQIALYLDAQYPDTPQLLPPPSRALQIALHETFVAPHLLTPTIKLLITRIARQLNPRSEEYFRQTRVPMFGMPLEDVAREQEQRKALVTELTTAMVELGKWKGEFSYLGGQDVIYADVMVAANLQWLRRVGDKAEWESVRGAITDKWGEFMEAFSKWDVISE
ncbi:hypothetical protein BV25DRAFT_1830063 [Artomyces pyxidatus]|uniref:Uncharacterized protein n=1 Tax=Artomyces pyxidatus TaxID=48021 RepID=A0ACB8SQB5_9AGAM|nr:hypothetical protein BV25DRAFT_1830063 [Artomyces pyxidatus]